MEHKNLGLSVGLFDAIFCHFFANFFNNDRREWPKKKNVLLLLHICLFVCSFFYKKVFKIYIYESHSEDNKKVEWLKGKCVCEREIVCVCVRERDSVCVCERER